jgi:hypothetical protein
MNCKNCKWWGRHVVGNTPSNKLRAICVDPNQPSSYEFQVHQKKDGWNYVINFWTYEDFGCINFKEK